MKFIGVSGVATTGKDEFANLAVKFFASKGLVVEKFALADQLKCDLYPLIKQRMGIDIFNCSPDKKELIRPIMVAYGCAQRENSNGEYWTSCLDSTIKNYPDLDIAIISDIRFAFYPGDENVWIKSKNGKIIHLTRLLSDGSVVQPANLEESKHDPLIKNAADYKLTWETSSEEDREKFVFSFFDLNRSLWEF